MKTTLAATAFIASLFATTTYAGPGPQYWASLHHKTATLDATKPAIAAPACPGSEEVAVTVMKPAGQNGRGPMTPVQVGTERVCESCPVTTVSSTHAAANGRGPATRVETTAVGATHPCGNGCAGMSAETTKL